MIRFVASLRMSCLSWKKDYLHVKEMKCTCSLLRLVCAKEVKFERQAREEETENETHSARLLYK